MSISSTSDRYQYIYGSVARNLDDYAPDRRFEKRMYTRTNQGMAVYQGQKMPASKKQEQLAVRNNKRRFYAVDRKLTVLLLFSVLLVAVACAAYVNKSSQVSNMSRQIKQLKTEKANLLNKQAAIKSEIDKSLDLEDIRSYAETNLKMVDPAGSKVIYYQDNSNDYFRQYSNVESGE